MKKLIFSTIIFLSLLAILLFLYQNKIDNPPKNSKQTIIYNPMEQNIKQTSKTFPELNLPKHFSVKLGETVYVNGSVKIKFLEIITDNRCPAGATCDTNGQAKVRVQLLDDTTDFTKAYISEVILEGENRNPETNELKPELITEQNQLPYKDLTITILDLSPIPGPNDNISDRPTSELLLKTN